VLQCVAASYSVVEYGAAWCGEVQCGAVWCSVVQCGAVRGLVCCKQCATPVADNQVVF